MKVSRQVIAAFVTGCAVTFVLSSHAQNAKSELDQRIEQARSLQEKGRTAEARKIYESLLPGLRDLSPSTQLGAVLAGMSQVASSEGDYELAIKSAQESADVYHQLGDRQREAHALNNKGKAEIQRGSYSAARMDLEKALTLSRSARDPENEAYVLNNLGSAYFFEGKYLEALRNYQDAMEVVDQNSRSGWSGYWRQITDFNQATLFQRLGRHEKALQIYRQVESSSGLTSGDRAHLFANLGALYRRLGDPYKALDSYRMAQKLYGKEHDADGELSVLKNIGIVYALDQGDLARAQQIFESALALAVKTHNRREEMQAHLYLGETFLREQSFDKAQAEFDQALSLATELGTTEEQWKALYGAGRLMEAAGKMKDAESNYRQAITIIEKTRVQLQLSALRAEFLADKRDVYDALILLLLQRQDVPEAFSYLERSRARTFQDRVTTPESGAAGTLTLDEVRSHLDRATILLEFWVSGERTMPSRIALIWCTRDGYGMELKQLSAKEQEDTLSFVNRIPNEFGEDWRQRSALLSAVLPQEFLSFPADMRHVMIVPDGWLSSVPFELLQAGPESDALLIERFDISYLPSAALLRRLRWGHGVSFPWTRELVAFGDPTVPRDQAPALAEALGASGALQPLPSSAEEIRNIAGMIRGKAELFLGRNDLKKNFLGGNANSAFLLHVSTHAFADGDNPEDSRILFSPEHPEGAAEYVFLRELYDLDLDNVSLATISACDTERGKIVRGEGVQAFSRALLSAGSRSALTALWRVDDAPTAEFMKQFYFFALEKRLPKAEALRMAKLKFLHSNTRLENPRYWAAFVLNGDGLTPLPAVLSWTSLTLFVAGLLVGFLVVWAWLRRGRKLHGQNFS